MEKCTECDCYEFESTQSDAGVCVCGHNEDKHMLVVLNDELSKMIADGIRDLEMHHQRIKTQIFHQDIIIEKIKKIWGVE